MVEHRTTYMTDAIGPLPYCPGCGHHFVIKALDKALVNLQLDPKEVVIVTDIGCIGLSDRYFVTNAFHGLHGRSITYGCGLKLARPELTVIVLAGDGGCGIGGAHLLNVARRNIGVTLIVANNFNYGMTGGQHSVTTPVGGVTTTTPWGNVEGPMDLCGTAVAAGAAWVARSTMFEKNLADTMTDAIKQPGFAMLDVWELCTAYYSPRNQLKKKDVDTLLDRYDCKLGVLADNPRPEYSESYREAYKAGSTATRTKTSIEQRFTSKVTKQTGIVIAGNAGQKIKSTATLFAQAAMSAGLAATQKDDYPITVMTGHSLAEIILSPQRIDYTAIETPDHLVLISAEGLERIRSRIGDLPQTSTIYTDENLDVPPTGARVVRLPLAATAAKIGRLSIAVIALGAVLKDTGMFPTEAFATAITMFQGAKIAEVNLKAVEAGASLVHPDETSSAP